MLSGLCRMCSAGLAAVLVLIFVCGCGLRVRTANVPPEFLDSKSKIGIVWTSSTKGCVYYANGGGLIGNALVRQANQKLIDNLASFPIHDKMTEYYTGLFSDEFNKIGFTPVSAEPLYYDVTNFLNAGEKGGGAVMGGKAWVKGWTQISEKKRKGKIIPADFDEFSKEEDLSHIFVTDVCSLGIQRNYGPMGIPVGGYKAQVIMKCYLADAKTGTIISQHQVAIKDPIEGEIDAPPDFQLANSVIDAALQKSLDQVFFFMFNRAP